ncbi:MAG: thiamine diphosphokinase [Clostridia bacterium]|nr:thiamine diphosphokinase [Clostridia bacterium]
MNILIISNGDITNYDFHLKLINQNVYDKIICADGGAVHAYNMGIKPDLVVGDLDSLSDHVLKYYENKGISFVKYPPKKDKTDTHIAVDHALEMNPSQIDMMGCIGSRFDHTYANILLMIRPFRQGIDIRMINEYNEIFVANGIVSIKGEMGNLISLLPLGGDVFIEQTRGLHYKIEEAILPIDFPCGTSNFLESDTAQIIVRSGLLLVIKARDR